MKMTKTVTNYYIGIDVSKDKLDVFVHTWSQPKVFDNSPTGLRALFKDLAALRADFHLVCEASGGYESQLLAAAWSRDRTISRVNARQVRDFALIRRKTAGDAP